jgi:hypothetical protein
VQLSEAITAHRIRSEQAVIAVMLLTGLFTHSLRRCHPEPPTFVVAPHQRSRCGLPVSCAKGPAYGPPGNATHGTFHRAPDMARGDVDAGHRVSAPQGGQAFSQPPHPARGRGGGLGLRCGAVGLAMVLSVSKGNVVVVGQASRAGPRIPGRGVA